MEPGKQLCFLTFKCQKAKEGSGDWVPRTNSHCVRMVRGEYCKISVNILVCSPRTQIPKGFVVPGSPRIGKQAWRRRRQTLETVGGAHSEQSEEWEDAVGGL
jgi:hypothetical protein